LLQWGQTEGNPGITPLFNFNYGADCLLFGFTFKIKIRFFNQGLQPSGLSNYPHSSKPATLCAMLKLHEITRIIMTTAIELKIKHFLILLITLFLLIILTSQPSTAQCTTNHVVHRTGSVIMNGITVTTTSKGQTDSLNYCPSSTFPYLIGAIQGTNVNGNGSFSFTFSPPVDTITLNFSGISYRQNQHEELIVLTVNGAHYPIPSVGISNGCNPLAVLTTSGDIRGCSNCTTSGWSGTIITGPIDSITILDSVVIGMPNGSLFSLFFCGKFTPQIVPDGEIKVSVYPNPFHENLNVVLNENKTAEIIIYDITGRKIFTSGFTKSIIINTSSIATGVYVYKIIFKKKILKKGKLIKQ